MRSLALTPLVVLVAACEEKSPPPADCNETCDPANRTVAGTYVPYRWCDDVASEAERIYGTYTCTSEEVDLGDEGITMTVEPYGDLEDSLTVIGVVVEDECLEFVTWYIDVAFTSEAFAAFIPSAIKVYSRADGDSTRLFDGLYDRDAIDGWLLDGVEGAQNISIVSRTDVGDPDKRWMVYIGNFDEKFELSCE